ncbi:MAG: isoamylase early set domain-containing protein, partial [Armatimonadetes bacterium]|nr:isoamylase early set domain-containing protein [Armatimonadota bacterium]
MFLMIGFDNSRPKDFRAFGWIFFGFLLFVSSAVSFSASCPKAGPRPVPGDRKVVLVFHPPQPARTVHVVGSFNHWDREATPLEGPSGDGAFRGVLYLPPGRYVYKFLVDGRKWIPDPSASRTEDDGFGGRNSVLEVGTMPSRKTGDGRIDYESLMHR